MRIEIRDNESGARIMERTLRDDASYYEVGRIIAEALKDRIEGNLPGEFEVLTDGHTLTVEKLIFKKAGILVIEA